MRKMLIALLGLAILASASAFATSTRTLVMGDNNMIMVDDNNMSLFPGRVNKYPNLALGEFAYYNQMYSFGVTWQFNETNPWVLGTFISEQPGFGPQDFTGSDLARFPNWFYNFGFGHFYNGPYTSYSEPRRVQLLYGRQFGGYDFGVSLDVVRYGWKADQDSTVNIHLSNKAKQNFHQYTLGLGLTEATTGKWDLGLQVMFGGWTNEYDTGDKINKPKGFMDISVAGRYFMVRNPKLTFVPHIQAGTGKRGVENYDNPNDGVFAIRRDSVWTMENSLTMIDLGAGFNYTPGPNMLAVFDVGFMYMMNKKKYSGNGFHADTTGGNWMEVGEWKATYFTFPYLRIGFEGEVFNWMDVRAGGTSSLWFNTHKYETDFGLNETYDYTSNQTYLGLGLHWGKLYLDTYTDPRVLLKGFEFISGNDGDGSNYDLNYQVSMIYEMF